MVNPSPLDQLVRKLRSRAPIGEAAERAVLALPIVPKTYEAPAYLVREGASDLRTCAFIVSGFAYRQKLTAEGAR